jgi:hypothetical protein
MKHEAERCLVRLQLWLLQQFLLELYQTLKKWNGFGDLELLKV